MWTSWRRSNASMRSCREVSARGTGRANLALTTEPPPGYTPDMTALLMMISGGGLAYGGFRLMAGGEYVGIGMILIGVGGLLGIAGLFANHADHIGRR